MNLYKYLKPSQLIVLESKSIRFTQPCYFNDPFEFKPVLDEIVSNDFAESYIQENFDNILHKELEKYKELISLIPERQVTEFFETLKSTVKPTLKMIEPAIIKDLKNQFDQTFKDSLGVLCLSSRWDSILMWGHYADSHKGFVLGFDSQNPFFNQKRTDKDEFGWVRKVNYAKERPRVSLSNSGSIEWFLTKNGEWEYESEYRMLLPLSQSSPPFVVNSEKIHLYNFPAEAISEILIGSRADEDIINSVIQIAKSIGVPVYKTFIDDNLFKINKEKL